jgi:hypothetical protein
VTPARRWPWSRTSAGVAMCCPTWKARRPCWCPPARSWSWPCKRRRRWQSEGIATRVVSMPCTNVFDRQSDAYQESVLPLGAACGCHRGSAPGLLAQIRGPHRCGGGHCQLRRVGSGQGFVCALSASPPQRVVDAVRTLAHRAPPLGPCQSAN